MTEEVDWREMRARLMAQAAAEGGATTPTKEDGGYVYESPLIEQGTVLLGGTKQNFGFALRQQFFHKCVLLLLEHDEQFTKGIILNRPSALEMDGWRLWCGHGQVAEGGLFVGEDAKMGELEINCLHSLEGLVANKLSKRVIKGVSYTSLQGAKMMVQAGVAKQSDFYVCVGYSGWAPGQLQMEVDKRDSWYLASADSGTLLKELLKQSEELPPTSYYSSMPGAPSNVDDLLGVETWESLMEGIGRSEDVASSKGGLDDRMLSEWIRVHLLPRASTPETPSTLPQSVSVGTVLCTKAAPTTGRASDRFLLRDQYLHKAIILIIEQREADGKWVGCVLNRPTATVVEFNTPGKPRRRLPFCGDRRIRAADGGGQLWLTYKDGPDVESRGTEIGDSGLYQLPSEDVMSMLQEEEMEASDLLVVGGAVEFGRAELIGMLTAGEMSVVPSGGSLNELWPRVWSLTDLEGAEDEPSDGTDAWYIASQCGASSLTAPAPSGIADEALSEWLKFFARS